jgi:hypothetical protein
MSDFHFHVHHHFSFDPDQLETIMTGLSDLTAAVEADTAATTANTAAVTAAIAALQSGSTGDSDSAVEALATTLNANIATRKADTARLVAATPPAALIVTGNLSMPPAPGVQFTATLTVTDGTGPFTASVTGNPPAGLDGTVAGSVVTVNIPLPAASVPPVEYKGAVVITDSLGAKATVPFDWTF